MIDGRPVDCQLPNSRGCARSLFSSIHGRHARRPACTKDACISPNSITPTFTETSPRAESRTQTISTSSYKNATFGTKTKRLFGEKFMGKTEMMNTRYLFCRNLQSSVEILTKISGVFSEFATFCSAYCSANEAVHAH